MAAIKNTHSDKINKRYNLKSKGACKKRAEEKSISLITPIIGQVIDMKNLIDTESWWEKFINVIK